MIDWYAVYLFLPVPLQWANHWLIDWSIIDYIFYLFLPLWVNPMSQSLIDWLIENWLWILHCPAPDHPMSQSLIDWLINWSMINNRFYLFLLLIHPMSRFRTRLMTSPQDYPSLVHSGRLLLFQESSPEASCVGLDQKTALAGHTQNNQKFNLVLVWSLKFI